MKKSLDIYDDIPSGMKSYISNYGFHFNKKACEYAVRLMKKNTGEGEVSIKITNKDSVDDLLSRSGVKINNKTLYDYVFVFNMGKTDFLGRSIPDEEHLCMFVKDYLDDPDASEDTTFRRWLATMVGNGEPIEWEDLL